MILAFWIILGSGLGWAGDVDDLPTIALCIWRVSDLHTFTIIHEIRTLTQMQYNSDKQNFQQDPNLGFHRNQ